MSNNFFTVLFFVCFVIFLLQTFSAAILWRNHMAADTIRPVPPDRTI